MRGKLNSAYSSHNSFPFLLSNNPKNVTKMSGKFKSWTGREEAGYMKLHH